MNYYKRWKERFQKFKNALVQLHKAADLADNRPLSNLESQGLIKAFELVYELSWHTIKDYLLYQGNVVISGSRDAFREAFAANLIQDGKKWMGMISDRNQTVHVYDEDTASKIEHKIRQVYIHLFIAFEKEMDTRL